MSVAKLDFTDRVVPIVQLGLGDSRIEGPEAARWDLAEWDDPSSLWAGTYPFWLDITCHTHHSQWMLGRARSTDRFKKGTASITVANDGWADPIPTDDDPALLTLRAGRAIRIGVDHVEFGIIWQFHGYIDTIAPRYDAELADVVDISAICALGESGRAKAPKLETPVGSGELANERITRIADAVKWPALLRDISPTGVAMLPTVLGDQAINMFQIVADSSGGAVFGDTEGRLAFRGRDWQMFAEDDPLDGTIGNVTTSGSYAAAVEDPPGSGLFIFAPDEWVESPAGSELYDWVGA